MPRFPLKCSSEEDCPMVHGGNSDRKANKLPLFTWIKKGTSLTDLLVVFWGTFLITYLTAVNGPNIVHKVKSGAIKAETNWIQSLTALESGFTLTGFN